MINAVQRGPEEMRHPPHPPHPLRQRRILWTCVLGWTAFVAFVLWWLFKGNGGLSVWVFLEQDLNQSGFTDRVQSIFRGELGLQRTYPWILFGPYLALMAWYFPLERERLRRNLPLNAAACFAFAWACHAINLRTIATRPQFVMVYSDQAPGSEAAPSEPNGVAAPGRLPTSRRFAGSDGQVEFRRLAPRSPPARSRKASLRFTVLDLLAYGAIIGLVHSVNFHRRLRERERRALFLESNLANARLNTLKAQLQPHFLFNSLNAITALLRRDPRLAETTLVALSELLRLALSQSERQELALREELEFVERYLEIQQTRFGGKLRVELDIDPEALDCLVPTLVLQPLVENAIRHGIEPVEKMGVVRVSASREEGNLVLTVEDDGAGLASDSGGWVRAPGAPVTARSVTQPLGSVHPGSSAPGSSSVLARAGTGIGLANLRERLQALYGARQRLELKSRATGGAIVRVEIPWQPQGVLNEGTSEPVTNYE